MHWSRTVKIFVLFNVLLFVGLFFLVSQPVQAQPGASLYFSPASGTKNVGATFPVAVLVNSGGQSINAAEGEVDFDSNKLEVLSISKYNSIFNIWTTAPAFSNRNGTVSFGGGLPSPGYTGTNGTIIRITFRVKVAGAGSSTEITFASVTVLANDGQGTNILSGLGRAAFSIGSPALPSPSPIITEKPTPTTNKTITAIQVTSPSHPDQSKWYANNNPEFQWTLPSGSQEVLLVLGKKSTSIPTISYIPPISNRKLDNVADGVWYFNGKVRTSIGPEQAFSYKFNVDVTPPRNFTVTRTDSADPTNPKPEFLWSATDETSGISRYEIKIDNQDAVTVGTESAGIKFALSPQFPGEHTIIVNAFDRGNNVTSASASFEIASIQVPVIVTIPTKVKEGELVHITGTTKPGYRVRLLIIDNNGIGKSLVKAANLDTQNKSSYAEAELQKDAFQITETQSNGLGGWSIDIPSIKHGNYSVYALSVDDRGARSSLSDGKTLEVSRLSIEPILNFLNRTWQVLLDFLANQWLWILLVLFSISVTAIVVEEVIPALSLELQKLRYISSEYKLHKELGIKTKRTLLELKLLNNDIKKELALLSKIEQHRGLQSDEKYLKEKLEKYLQILKTIR